MPCLRVWPRQYQNRKRERPGDCQELGHRGRKLTLQGLLSLEGQPESPGTPALPGVGGHQSRRGG